jgi:hypothetical protein
VNKDTHRSRLGTSQGHSSSPRQSRKNHPHVAIKFELNSQLIKRYAILTLSLKNKGTGKRDFLPNGFLARSDYDKAGRLGVSLFDFVSRLDFKHTHIHKIGH